MDDIVKNKLRLCQISSKGLITGYLKSKEEFDELVRDLKAFGCSYAVRSCSVGKPEKGTLQYRTFASDVQVPFTGCPFHVDGTTYYQCAQGSRYYKSKSDNQGDHDDDDDENNEAPKKKRRKVQKSIKIGCPAKMTVKCIRIYPDYFAETETWRRKSVVIKQLKADLKLDPLPRHEVHYWIALSPESVHTHKRTMTQKFQYLHPDLIAEIHRLVFRGITSVPVIKSQLKNFVRGMFNNSSVLPNPSNTAFYPTDKSIYNHVYDAKKTKTRKNQNSASKNAEKCTDEPLSIINVVEKDATSVEVIPVVEGTFPNEWRDASKLPSNLMQVVNSNGTIVLMVTTDSIPDVNEANGDETSELVKVNLRDDLYTVSVSDGGQIISLASEDETVISQTDEASNRTSVVTLVPSEKANDKLCTVDMNRVITMDGNVVLDVRQSSLEDREQLTPNDQESLSQYSSSEQLFENREPIIIENLPSVEILEPPNAPSPVLSCIEIESSQDSSAPAESVVFQSSEDSYLLKSNNQERQTCLKIAVNKTDLHMEELQCQDEDERSQSLQSAISSCAQDIINLSYSCTNVNLLAEIQSTLDKCRKRMFTDLEGKSSNFAENDEIHISITECENALLTTDDNKHSMRNQLYDTL